MKEIVAKIDFQSTINGKQRSFIKGDKITGLKYNQIAKLNELGFIEPLNYRDLVLIKRELEKEDLE